MVMTESENLERRAGQVALKRGSWESLVEASGVWHHSHAGRLAHHAPVHAAEPSGLGDLGPRSANQEAAAKAAHDVRGLLLGRLVLLRLGLELLELLLQCGDLVRRVSGLGLALMFSWDSPPVPLFPNYFSLSRQREVRRQR